MSTSPAVPDFSSWLSSMHPLEVYALAVGTVMGILAVGMWLASVRADRRALRLFSLRYALAAPGWIWGHPQAHGAAADAPLVPMAVAVGLLALTVWALDEFLGRSTLRRRAVVAAVALATLTALAVLRQVLPGHAGPIYFVMGLAMGICAVMSWLASEREPGVGHRYVAAAFASYPLLLLVVLPFQGARQWLDLAYLIAIPGIVVGVSVLIVSLTRSARRTDKALNQKEKAEQELRHLNASLEQRVVERTDSLRVLVDGMESFTRTVSHDLRGSLSGVSGVLKLAVAALDQDDRSRAARLMRPLPAELDQMSELVRSLLELSRVAAVDLRTQRQSAQVPLQAAIAALHRAPDTAPLLERVTISIDELPAVDADPVLLQQVFVNLVGNALRFAASRERGQVRIGSHAQDGQPGIFVNDNGPGFDPGRAAELFVPFRRLHGQDLSRHGVGLSIVRRIVERHGGRVWADAEPGHGATFWFTLPVTGA